MGRARELELLAVLEARGEKLVTLHGGAGIGKTRLAREYLRRGGDERGSFVDLSEARTTDDFAAALSAALGLSIAPQASAASVLAAAALRLAQDAPALLVLDNFEQLVDAAEMVTRALLAVPGLTVVVTSRTVLSVAEEIVVELSPLSLSSGEGGTRSEALMLLVDRVMRLDAGFDDTAEREACEAIARELDGIPLALELAAPRIALLGAVTVRDRLHDRLGVLDKAPRDAARHQRTLRTAIDGSWNLLAVHERRALAQLGVFRGSFGFEAIEEIVDPSDATTTMAMVQSLREKSLLVRALPGANEPRFALYLSIRDYAREKLDEEPPLAAAAFERHARYYLAHAETLAKSIERSNSAEELDRFATDRENVVALVERALAAPPSAARLETALRALLALGRLTLARGPLEPLVMLVERALSFVGIEVDPLLVGATLLLRARCNRRWMRLVEAERDARAALEIGERRGARALQGRAYEELTTISWGLGRSREAQAMAEFAERIHSEMGDVRHEGIALTRAAVHLREEGRVDEARAQATRAAELLRSVRDEASHGMALTELAFCALEAGQLGLARNHAEHAVASVGDSGNWLHRAFVEGIIGLVALAEGNLEACLEQFDALLPNVREVGYGRFEGGVRGYSGVARLELGDTAGAIADLERACAGIVGAHDVRYRSLFLAFLAAARAVSGDVVGAQLDLDQAMQLDGGELLREAIEVVGAAVDVVIAGSTGRMGVKNDLVRVAVQRIEQASGETTMTAAAFHLRLALRVARRTVAPLELGGVRDAAGGRPLVVDVDGAWAELPSGERIECRDRRSQRLLLLELSQRRNDSPGVPVDPRRLVAAGWPDERILPAAAKNRLRVAITMLRKAGLRDLLVTQARGYFLDPAVPFQWAAPGGARTNND